MGIFDALSLISGLALFLYGMEVMGEALRRSAGNRLKAMLGKMTSSPGKGFLLGLIVTAIIQSSSATTVMVVGFVNSGTMTLTQSVGVILGAELGTAVTAWLTALSGIGGSGAVVSSYIAWLKPSSWMPLLALAGICMLMFSKNRKRQDVGRILLGFSVLMVGMDIMSGSVSGLRDLPEFQSFLTMFRNPLLGVLTGMLLTAIVQSSSASIGILQSLTTTGSITYGMAIPIIMGQNIGTCITAILASIGANKNGKRAAFVHLYFNVIGTAIWLTVFALVGWLAPLSLFGNTIDMWGVATVHTGFKILSLLLLFPFHRQLERLAVFTIRGREEKTDTKPLDERLFGTPAVAVERAEEVTRQMADLSCSALRGSLRMFASYDDKQAASVRETEDRVDVLEDEIGSYLVRLSGCSMDEKDSHEVTKLLRLIGDFERISDHAVNLLESAEEIRDKRIEFSQDAQHELSVLMAAVTEILTLSHNAFAENSIEEASRVEPLEEHIDKMREQIKVHHILRLQKSECTIEHGFILSDILTNLERVADHCSNVAGCIIEISRHDALDMHRYLGEIKQGGADFDRMYQEYRNKYVL